MKPKTHTTNYKNTFIEVALDSKATCGTVPPTLKEGLSLAGMHFNIIAAKPYQFTSDEVMFEVFAQRKNILPEDINTAKSDYFSKGQPCFRASALTKQYGWGIHANEIEKIAIFGVETAEYEAFVKDEKITKVKAMRGSK